ncbi:MAG: thiamine diphosphokinase [Acholeplasmatales bacterium]|nr:thiamine diphosphokinase [Acholeplasmatales bacterium]
MNRCIIIGAGEFSEKQIIKTDEDFLIVCDGGYNNYLKLDNCDKLSIDLLIGDFDSFDIEKIDNKNIKKIVKLNPIKDDTDVVDAVKYGLEMGYNEFCLYGCLGGRLEHSIANIQILAYIKDNNANGYIIDESKRIIILKDEEISLTGNGYISIFALSGKVSGVTLKNLKYELNNATLSNSFPLGIDNEFIDKPAFIKVKKGKLLVIYTVE